ncbi:MAG: hypothetical protein RMN52_01220 [Anaerolineae bacterium]|nr:hypothetical protein [Candidatus Roseilinea sp.]MDW8448599.1 hypothetical protein [Anaerolineae bacterium]
MDKRIVRVIAAGVGAAFVLTACAVSNRQIVTGPNGLVIAPLNFTPPKTQQAAPVAQPAEERTTLPAPVQEKAPQPSSAPEQSGKAAPATEAAKSVEQTKAVEKATGAKSHGCGGYGYAESYSSTASDD